MTWNPEAEDASGAAASQCSRTMKTLHLLEPNITPLHPQTIDSATSKLKIDIAADQVDRGVGGVPVAADLR